MKVIVQIPCYNEEETLPRTLREIPRQMEGVDRVEILVIDDGSTDRTAQIARELGADYVLRNKTNMGLAGAFRMGLDACLKRGADIIVNTDGDNQYFSTEIPALIHPILAGEADLVIGDRQPSTIEHFSRHKKILQSVGSGIVRWLAGIHVPDTVSGFRAISREAALKMNIVSSFSYTIESVIQAGNKQMAVKSVPIRTRPKTRESRLAKSTLDFIIPSATTIVRMHTMYQPLLVFFCVGITFFLLGVVPITKFLVMFFAGSGAGHVQSLVIGGALMTIGFITILLGMVADLISFNRQLLETVLEKVRCIELQVVRSSEEKADAGKQSD